MKLMKFRWMLRSKETNEIDTNEIDTKFFLFIILIIFYYKFILIVNIAWRGVLVNPGIFGDTN